MAVPPDAAPRKIIARCPECGLGATEARARALRRSGWSRALPWMVLGAVVVFQIARAGVQFRLGWGVFTRTNPPPASFFVGLEHGNTRAELERLAAQPHAGDGLVRDLIHDREFLLPTPDDHAVDAGFAPPRGMQLLVVQRGWPVRWTNINIKRDTDDVFGAQSELFGAAEAPGPVESTSVSTWGFGAYQRSAPAGISYSAIVLRRAAAIGVVLLIALSWLLARGLRRLTARRWRRWVIAVGVAGACTLALGWRLDHVRSAHLAVAPDAAGPTATALAPTGLTVADLRALVGSPDGDARAAAALLRVLPAPAAASDVLVAAQRPARPMTVRFAELGWPERVMFFSSAWAPDPANPLARTPLPPAPGLLTPQFGSVWCELPVRAGDTRTVGWSLDLPELAVWALRLWLVSVVIAAADAWIRRARARARRRADRCLCCGYDLSAAPAAGHAVHSARHGQDLPAHDPFREHQATQAGAASAGEGF